MLKLPDVTLVMVETREHELARLAVEDCLEKATFGEICIFTDNYAKFPSEMHDRYRFMHVEDWPTKEGWSRFLWNEVAPHVRTSHMLSIQWDSWIVDPEAWDDEFLRYDYIGAPWWYTDGMNIGNGGFSLRSTALMRYLSKNRDKFPCTTSLDDDLLCRKYRPRLMEAGFEWAPQMVADHFAFECVAQVTPKVFGFHGIFNWPKVLDPEALRGRIAIAAKSKYIRSNSHMWGQLCKAYPAAAELVLDQ